MVTHDDADEKALPHKSPLSPLLRRFLQWKYTLEWLRLGCTVAFG